MQSFGWKRKIGLSNNSAAAFTGGGSDNEELEQDVDWLTASKRPKISGLSLEDAEAKAKRLLSEGIIYAEMEKWWTAINRWKEALAYTPNDHTIHEMMAQAYIQVGEVYPAVKSAEQAVLLCPTWWGAYQTLGRAQLGLGEVKMAVLSFERATHMQPDQMELWIEDLKWAHSLLMKIKDLQAEEKRKSERLAADTAQIFELDEQIEENKNPASTTNTSKQQALPSASNEVICESNMKSQSDTHKNVDFTKMVKIRIKHCANLQLKNLKN
ncbi:unnamed protein product, partial [Meganyctiphanes norvegica]